jgi:hypothetical protein
VGVLFVNWIVDASIFAVGLTSPAAIFDATKSVQSARVSDPVWVYWWC